MLNRTLVAVDARSTTKIAIPKDQRVSVSIEPGYKLMVVDVNSEQYQEFISGDPYLTSKTKEVKSEWRTFYSGDFMIPSYVYQTVTVYFTQRVEVRSIDTDNSGNAYVVYKEVDGEPKKHREYEPNRYRVSGMSLDELAAKLNREEKE